MRDLKKIIVLIIFSIVLIGCKSLVNKMAFHPDTVNLIPTDKLPVGIEEKFIRTEDDVKIQCLYLPASGADNIVIYFHGNAGNIYHRIPELIQLRRFGVNVIGVSYRGYGKSEGSPSEEGIYKDGNAVLEYVTKGLGFSPNKVIIFGRSIGTTVAINTSQFKEIGGLILVTPLTSGVAQANAAGMSSVTFLAGDSFNNLSKMKNIKVPLLVIHGTHDRVIPFSMGKEIYDNATVDKKFIKIDGADHNDIHDRYRQLYWPPILEFLKVHAG